MTASLGDKISVCLLTYNHVNVIESTLASILDQTINGYEVIVSDDCSTDGTWERIQAMASTDPRIRAIQTPKNLGMPGNANFAVSQTNRPYIALLHHDDIYRKDLLEKWAGVMTRYSDVGFVFNPYGKYGSDFIYREKMPGEYIPGRWLLDNYLFARWGCVVRGTAMIRREAWYAVGGMRESYGLLADIDLWMRLAMRGPVGYVDEPLITVRHARPEYYPDIYRGKNWHWSRLTLLYEIHATNRIEYLDLSSICGRVTWWNFRWRLNLETAKWLTYALVRKKWPMIESSAQSATAYDFWWLKGYRYMLQRVLALQKEAA
jgi:glycosyltransferase involved in cell wall biosynthesis